MHARTLASILLAAAAFTGCARPSQTRSGFLSTYDGMKRVNQNESAYLDHDGLSIVSGILLEEPRLLVETTPDGTPITPDIAAELTTHVRLALAKSLADAYPLVDAPAPGVVRLRVAITEVRKPAVLLNLHPASKLTGAGLGGATIESEIMDTATGTRLASLVESRRGDQFELDTLSEFDDAQDAIDAWAAALRRRLDDARARGAATAAAQSE